MGSLGAFNVQPQMLGPLGTGYPFKAGGYSIWTPPMSSSRATHRRGAHSDIFHPELAWVVAAAGGLNTA